jgi:hypothetical protein
MARAVLYPLGPRLRRLRAGGLGLLALLGVCGAAHSVSPRAAESRAGEIIYRQGVLPSGLPLSGRRDSDLSISGADAACVNCHRRSGLGGVEGKIKIPPVGGKYLFHRTGRDVLDLPPVDGMRDRDAYSDDTLARAIREGIGADGNPLNLLMPRYALSDGELAELTAYLKSMTPAVSRGVTGAIVHFATIVTPDADPVKRDAMLQVMDQYFAGQNALALDRGARVRPSAGPRPKHDLRWQLHVWTLTGPPDGWTQQLHGRLAQEPVFAAIAGAGGRDWDPVHRFCEEASLPCLFPNIELPVVAEQDFYPLYFSKGVLLEAGLMASRLGAQRAAGEARRIVQIYRAGDVGEGAAAALRAALKSSDVQVAERRLGRSDRVDAAVRNVGSRDTAVLWLRPDDIAALTSPPTPGLQVLMSGLMGGLDHAPLPAAWRTATEMSYPVELPERRRVPVDYALGWFALWHIPVRDEKVQVDTYVTCNVLSETMTHVGDALSRDYFVETVEAMLEHQLISGYYPRLRLATNERFGSKGGYWVHFARPVGSKVTADTDWVTP